MKTFILDVYGGGFNGVPFDAASVQLDHLTIARILALAGEVKRLDVYKVQLFDHCRHPRGAAVVTSSASRWLTRYRLLGSVTWCLNRGPGWFRIGNRIFRWEL